jgi:hypothetical protein
LRLPPTVTFSAAALSSLVAATTADPARVALLIAGARMAPASLAMGQPPTAQYPLRS